MSKLFDSDGNEIGSLDGGLFNNRHSGSIFGEDGNKIGEVSSGGFFDPAPNGFPGDKPVFDSNGRRIGYTDKRSGLFGKQRKGTLFDDKGHRIGRSSTSGSPKINTPGSDDGAMLLGCIYLLVTVGAILLPLVIAGIKLIVIPLLILFVIPLTVFGGWGNSERAIRIRRYIIGFNAILAISILLLIYVLIRLDSDNISGISGRPLVSPIELDGRTSVPIEIKNDRNFDRYVRFDTHVQRLAPTSQDRICGKVISDSIFLPAHSVISTSVDFYFSPWCGIPGTTLIIPESAVALEIKSCWLRIYKDKDLQELDGVNDCS